MRIVATPSTVGPTIGGGRRRCSASRRCADVQVMADELYRGKIALPPNLLPATVIGHAVWRGELIEPLDDLSLVERPIVITISRAEKPVDQVDQLVQRHAPVAIGVRVADEC